jgi:hypothetical protein
VFDDVCKVDVVVTELSNACDVVVLECCVVVAYLFVDEVADAAYLFVDEVAVATNVVTCEDDESDNNKESVDVVASNVVSDVLNAVVVVDGGVALVGASVTKVVDGLYANVKKTHKTHNNSSHWCR